MLSGSRGSVGKYVSLSDAWQIRLIQGGTQNEYSRVMDF